MDHLRFSMLWLCVSLFWMTVSCVDIAPECNTTGYETASYSDLMSGPLAVCAACNFTLYPALCSNSLFSTFPQQAQIAPPSLLTILSLNISYNAISNVSHHLLAKTNLSSPLKDCVELMASSQDQLANSMSTLANLNMSSSGHVDPVSGKPVLMLHYQIQDALVWTSAALTYQSTCSDGLTINDHNDATLQAMLDSASHYVSASLTLVNKLRSHLCSWYEPDSSTFPNC